MHGRYGIQLSNTAPITAQQEHNRYTHSSNTTATPTAGTRGSQCRQHTGKADHGREVLAIAQLSRQVLRGTVQTGTNYSRGFQCCTQLYTSTSSSRQGRYKELHRAGRITSMAPQMGMQEHSRQDTYTSRQGRQHTCTGQAPHPAETGTQDSSDRYMDILFTRPVYSQQAIHSEQNRRTAWLLSQQPVISMQQGPGTALAGTAWQ